MLAAEPTNCWWNQPPRKPAKAPMSVVAHPFAESSKRQSCVSSLKHNWVCCLYLKVLIGWSASPKALNDSIAFIHSGIAGYETNLWLIHSTQVVTYLSGTKANREVNLVIIVDIFRNDIIASAMLKRRADPRTELIPPRWSFFSKQYTTLLL